MKEESGNASQDDCHGGYYWEQQQQNAGAQDPNASGRGEGQGKCSADEYGQRGCHRVQVVAGVAVFFADFFASFGIVTTIAAAPSGIAGGNRLVPASIKASSSRHNSAGVSRT